MRLYKFDDVIGNSQTVTILRQSVINHSFKQISVFSGMYGTGKSTCAEITGLALTCKEPVNGNPCLLCDNCRSTLSALRTTGASSHVIKINVAQKNTKADVDEMIRDIFILKASDTRVVYIIEEAHALSDAQQTALLEELDKIPEGVFVIFCTTKLTKLLPELRSRAIDFTFGRINDQDADKLLNKLCVKNNYPMDDKVKRVLISNARGIPRKLTNLFDFVASGQYKSETIAQFLGVIDEEDFITLFDVMKLEDMFIFVNTVDGLLKENQADALIEQLKEFILRVIFLLEGNIADGFSQKETQQIREIFAGVNVTQLANYVTSLPTNCSEVDFKYALFKMRQTMQNRSIKQLVGSNSVVAVKQDIRATTVAKELEHTKKVEQNTNQLNGLNMAFMNNFGGN